MSIVFTLTHFPLELGSKDYSFLNQAVEDFEHTLDSILIESIDTPELDAFLEEIDAMPYSVSSFFLYLVSPVSDTSRLKLASSIKSFTLCCQARALVFACLTGR